MRSASIVRLRAATGGRCCNPRLPVCCIPYVQRFHVFGMPLLGYAGYLPFGIACALVTDLVARLVAGRAETAGG